MRGQHHAFLRSRAGEPRAWTRWATVLLFAWVLAGRARADAEPEVYRVAVEQALAEYAAHNYEEASALFKRAHEVYPNARTLRGLGMASYELRRYRDGIEQLEAALASKVRPLEDRLRAETEELLSRARGFVAQVALTVVPREASVAVDGEHTALRDDEPLLVELGDHTLEVSAAGYRPERQNLRVHGGERLSLRFELAPEASVAVAPAGAQRPVDEVRPLRKSPWLWTAVGAVVVGGVVGGVLLARAQREESTIPQPTSNDVGFVLKWDR